MDTKKFFEIINDKRFPDYKKLCYKYPEDIKSFFETLSVYYTQKVSLPDFSGNDIGFIPMLCRQDENHIKYLSTGSPSVKSLESEIIATSAIESVDTKRESVRKILKGLAPESDEESRIYGLKKGFEFISDVSNKITEENFYKLYMMAIGEYLDEENKLPFGKMYRDNEVFVVGSKVDHMGLPFTKIPEYMGKLFEFANIKDNIPSTVKAAIIHFYISYIHPYFDGNGRMARLVHLWFLVQQGYPAALFVPFSSNIEKTRSDYYKAFTLIEENAKVCGFADLTPFVTYFNDNVYDMLGSDDSSPFEISEPERFTEKEHELWKFVVAFYGTNEFSTKQLEKDSGLAAYATIREFVIKFTDAGLLERVQYSGRCKYKIFRRN